MKRNPSDSLSRRSMKLLCKLLGILFVAMLASSMALQALLEPVTYVDPGPAGEDSALSVFSPVSLGFTKPHSSADPIGGADSGILNILLVGQDRREDEETARSDSMILCTFHKESKTLTMTSFLRDLYVEIPGRGSNRINAAYAIGGIQLLKQTLAHNFQLQIDGSVEVDFSQFASIIDTLGGVELELRSDEARIINQETGSALAEGTQRLTGTQALAYSRIRNLDRDGDFSRTNRQRKVIGALMEAYRELSLKELVPLVSRLLPMLTTDMNNGQLLVCAMEILPYLSQAQVISQHVPAEGDYTDAMIDGMSVLKADPAAIQQMLRETLLKKG